jgi:hypothetical protein
VIIIIKTFRKNQKIILVHNLFLFILKPYKTAFSIENKRQKIYSLFLLYIGVIITILFLAFIKTIIDKLFANANEINTEESLKSDQFPILLHFLIALLFPSIKEELKYRLLLTKYNENFISLSISLLIGDYLVIFLKRTIINFNNFNFLQEKVISLIILIVICSVTFTFIKILFLIFKALFN